MPIYDIDGNIITTDSISEIITVKKNNKNLVDEFIGVAETYLNQTSIEYKDGDTILYKSTATNGIDCSTFVNLCLMGWEFNDTPYVTHNYIQPSAWEANNDYDWSICPLKYEISRYIDNSNPTEMVRLACQLGHWMYSRNQVVPMDNGFEDVQVGDIVFWARKVSGTDEWSHPTWWKHINHVGIIYSKEDAPSTYVDGNGNTQTWDKSKYPYKHTIIDCGNTTPTVRTTKWLEEGQEDSTNVYANNVNTVCLICRPDLGALQSNN